MDRKEFPQVLKKIGNFREYQGLQAGDQEMLALNSEQKREKKVFRCTN